MKAKIITLCSIGLIASATAVGSIIYNSDISIVKAENVAYKGVYGIKTGTLSSGIMIDTDDNYSRALNYGAYINDTQIDAITYMVYNGSTGVFDISYYSDEHNLHNVSYTRSSVQYTMYLLVNDETQTTTNFNNNTYRIGDYITKTVGLPYQFNPYAWKGQNDGDYVLHQDVTTLTLYQGLFYSNGYYYTDIICYFTNAEGLRVGTNNSNYIINDAHSSYMVNMLYMDSRTHRSTTVITPQYVVSSSNGTDLIFTGHYNYTDLNLKTIQLIAENPSTEDNDTIFQNYTWYQILTSQTGLTGGGTGDVKAIDNVFELIALTFSAILPFASLQIAPYISLGLLLLTPTVLAIILAIIKVIKK